MTLDSQRTKVWIGVENDFGDVQGGPFKLVYGSVAGKSKPYGLMNTPPPKHSTPPLDAHNFFFFFFLRDILNQEHPLGQGKVLAKQALNWTKTTEKSGVCLKKKWGKDLCFYSNQNSKFSQCNLNMLKVAENKKGENQPLVNPKIGPLPRWQLKCQIEIRSSLGWGNGNTPAIESIWIDAAAFHSGWGWSESIGPMFVHCRQHWGQIWTGKLCIGFGADTNPII